MNIVHNPGPGSGFGLLAAAGFLVCCYVFVSLVGEGFFDLNRARLIGFTPFVIELPAEVCGDTVCCC
jgi:hypothetical protein